MSPVTYERAKRLMTEVPTATGVRGPGVAAALDITLTTEETDSLEAPYVTRRPTFF